MTINPMVIEHVAYGQLFQPIALAGESFLLLDTPHRFPVLGLAREPEAGRDSRDLLQLERGLLRQRSLSINKQADVFLGVLHPLCERVLIPAAFFKKVSDGVTGRGNPIWAKVI